jgi:uncharacterized protein (TIGR00255 family)
MTGFGEAHYQDDRLIVHAEIRALNNRNFRLVCRLSDPYDMLEPEIERLVREVIRRGSVQVSLRVDRPKRPEDYRLNVVALKSYQEQLQDLRPPGEPLVDPSLLLALPGVVEDRRTNVDRPHDDWPALAAVLGRALEGFHASRAREGQAMADELLALGEALSGEIERVAARSPEVVAGYQQRLQERLQALVKDRVTVRPEDLIREVAILADRSDVSEEVTRLRAHLTQFAETIRGPESAGRKLEFLVQEMGRETNTIGSKSNDVAISRSVVEMKSHLEKIRELIQNVE